MRAPSICLTLLIALVLTAGTGTATAHPLITEFHDGLTNGNGAWGVAAGPDGNVWFTQDNADQVARVTPDGVVTEFSAA